MLKRLFSILILVSIMASAFVLPIPAKAESVNLISNPSLEYSGTDLKSPRDWLSSKWGNNQATFEYKKDSAYDGQRSAYITMSQYASGDAKWYFKPVSVLPNMEYFFNDSYRSNVYTQTVVQIENTNGSFNYISLNQNTPSLFLYRNSRSIFKTPANAKEATIFHIINSNGYLETDNYVLRPVAESVITDNVANNSLEQVSDANSFLPLAWQKGKWGTNNAKFSYLNSGHSGKRSVETEITSYRNGDAKWYSDAQPINPNQNYIFTDYYKSSVPTGVTAMVTKTDGSIQYINLRDAIPSTTWAKYSDSFSTPDDAKLITIFHLISSVGYLITDDYSITQGQDSTTFKEGLVSITFDDGWQSQYTNAMPILNNYQFPATYYLVSSFLNQPNYMTKDQALSIKNNGSEIASHSVSHPFMTQLPYDQIVYQLSQSKIDLEKDFGAIKNFSVPYDDYNTQVITLAKNYYQSFRSSDSGFNTRDSYNVYYLKTQNIYNNTSSDQISKWVEQAKADKSWLILLYHQIDESGSEYGLSPANFGNHLQVIKTSGLKVVTVEQGTAQIASEL